MPRPSFHSHQLALYFYCQSSSCLAIGGEVCWQNIRNPFFAVHEHSNRTSVAYLPFDVVVFFPLSVADVHGGLLLCWLTGWQLYNLALDLELRLLQPVEERTQRWMRHAEFLVQAIMVTFGKVGCARPTMIEVCPELLIELAWNPHRLCIRCQFPFLCRGTARLITRSTTADTTTTAAATASTRVLSLGYGPSCLGLTVPGDGTSRRRP